MQIYVRSNETRGLLMWLVGFCVVFVFGRPIKLDFFPHYYWMFLYLSGSVLFVWIGRLIKGPVIAKFAVKLTLLTLIMAVSFVAFQWFMEGRKSHICNAAEYNYPTVLTLLLDPTDKKQLDLAFSCAKNGDSAEILEELKALGAE